MEKRTLMLLIAILVGLIGISLVGYAGAQTIKPEANSMPKLLREAGSRRFRKILPSK